MRVLLDNCIDVRAKPLFDGHDVEHVLDRGWDELVNGKLISTAGSAGFDVLVTVDKNLRCQQNLNKLPLSVVELDVVKNRMDEISALAPFIPQALQLASRFALWPSRPTVRSSASQSAKPPRDLR